MTLEQFAVVQLKQNLNEFLVSGIKALIVEIHSTNHEVTYDIYLYRPNKREFYVVEGCNKILQQFLEPAICTDEEFLYARKQFMLSWSRKRRKEKDDDKKSEITFLRLESKYGLSRNVLESIWKDVCRFKKENP